MHQCRACSARYKGETDLCPPCTVAVWTLDLIGAAIALVVAAAVVAAFWGV